MSTPAQAPAPQDEKKIPVVFGSTANAICPKCGNISLPLFTGTTTAVMCQNPACKFVAEKDAPAAQAPAAPAAVIVQPAGILADVNRPDPKPADQLQWLRFAEDTDQHRVTVEARVKQLTRASRIFRQNAETGVPFDRATAMQLLQSAPGK